MSGARNTSYTLADSAARPWARAVRVLPVIAWLVLLLPVGAQDFVLRDFGPQAFDYTFGGFDQTIGGSGVRITDRIDNAGGAGVGLGGLDLSGWADARFSVDFTPLAGNGAGQFDIELIDTFSDGQTARSGKWSFDVSSLTPGVPATLVSTTTLSNPTSGIGDFQNLDLTRIENWQVLGDFVTTEPFDIEFDRVAISAGFQPPPAYPGAEADAPWRAQAASQIESIRKANLAVPVVDLSGAPVPGASVSVSQREHEFGFGSAVQAFRLRNNAAQHDPYKAKVAELFNLATIENNLKWPPWEGEWGSLWTQSGAVAALDWLQSQGINTRGHAMVWPGETNLPADIRQMLDDGDLNASEQQAVRDRVANHIASIGGATDGKVGAWDVINETRTNNDLMNQLSEGDQAMVAWFQQAAAADADADLYINDFGILNNWGGASQNNRDQYFDTIQYLQNQGAPIDGIGFQGHFREGGLSGPEELWDVLDRFNELGLKMQVTEFDFETTDEELQAQFTRDFLTAMFAHEGVDDVLFWGFWEDAHWRPDAALFRSDWSIKPNGQAYVELVFDEWWTEEKSPTNAAGEATIRAFKGRHEVTVSANGAETAGEISVTDGGFVLPVVLPVLVGDYNGDGVVDAGDYTVYRDTLGSTSDLAADGNNDGVVDSTDYLVWISRFGAVAGSASASVPEPGWSPLWLLAAVRRRRGPSTR